MTLACRNLSHHGAAASQTCVCRDEPVRPTPMADNSSPEVRPLLDGPASADLAGGRSGTSGGISTAGPAHGQRPSPTGPTRRRQGVRQAMRIAAQEMRPARARPGLRGCPERPSPCRRGDYVMTPTPPRGSAMLADRIRSCEADTRHVSRAARLAERRMRGWGGDRGHGPVLEAGLVRAGGAGLRAPVGHAPRRIGTKKVAVAVGHSILVTPGTRCPAAATTRTSAVTTWCSATQTAPVSETSTRHRPGAAPAADAPR